MRVLAVHRFYWPDSPPYASMLRRIVRRWTLDGHQVDVLTGVPAYKRGESPLTVPRKQVDEGVEVHRMSLPNETGRTAVRVVNALRLSARTFMRAAFGGYDVVMVSTMPPVILGAAASIGCKISGAQFIYHCMDLHPEIGSLSGEFANAQAFSILRHLDTSSMIRAWAVVVLSGDMVQSVRSRPRGGTVRLRVRNNFALAEGRLGLREEDDLDADRILSSLPIPVGAVTLLFAGNVGRFQGLEDVVAAVRRARGSTPPDHFGGGSRSRVFGSRRSVRWYSPSHSLCWSPTRRRRPSNDA